MEWFSRTELLVGKEGLEDLQKSHVLIAGIGGVGSYSAEIIVRSGIGEVSLIDSDMIKPSNRNRQLPALSSTENMMKVDVMAARLIDINPQLKINKFSCFIKDEEIPEILNNKPDYIIDAIDSLTPKVNLIIEAVKREIPLISCMGAGGKMDPSKIQIAYISQSYNCKLARQLRKRLHKHGILKGFEVVFSPEDVDKNHLIYLEDEQNKKTTLGTISYMPALFGILAASQVIRKLLDS